MNQEFFVDVCRDLVAKAEGKLKYGWEITDEHGDIVDSKYGYVSFTQAARVGQRIKGAFARGALRKLQTDKKIA